MMMLAMSPFAWLAAKIVEWADKGKRVASGDLVKDQE